MELVMENDLLNFLRTEPDLAFEKIVKQYEQRLFQVAVRLLQDSDAADEVVQETFMSFYRNMHKFEGKSKVYTYLYRIAVNRSIDYIRKKKTRKNYEEEYLKENKSKIEAGYQEDLDIKIVLQKSLDQLDVKYRTPIVLLEYENMKYKEIAEVMGISLSAVKMRIFKGREKLLKILTNMGVSLENM